ncbi:MAG: molybdopterin molybdotransferase MoeA [Candidatus Asgardarchaeia archaeon]
MFQKLIRVEEALRIIKREVGEVNLGEEEVGVKEARGRVLSEDVRSNVNIPPFNRSAVDGYAVRSGDVFSTSEKSPEVLRVIGSAYAGVEFDGYVKPGEAVYITTGAKIPDGADSVVMVEYTKPLGEDKVIVYKGTRPYENVSRVGEDVKEGDVIYRKGDILRSFDLGVLASIGVCKVKVRKRLKVSVITTGNELVEPCEGRLEGDKIFDTNRLVLKNLLEEVGCEVLDVGIVPDDEELLIRTIKTSLHLSDAILISGGNSLGKYDLTPRAIENVGKPGVIFHGIAMQPGKPFLFASIGGKPIFGMPGFPVSNIIAFLEVVRPSLFHMMGLRGEFVENEVEAVLTRRVPSKVGIASAVRVSISKRDGIYYADVIRRGGAGVLSSVGRADGYFIVPEDKEGYEAGEVVRVKLFSNFLKGVR